MEEPLEAAPAALPGEEQRPVSRRKVMVTSGALVAGAGIAGATAACDVVAPATQMPEPAKGAPPIHYYPEVPAPPDTPPPPEVLKALTPHQAQTVDAVASRIMPGSPDDPGAHEAGVVTYIDNMLAFHEGYDRPTYTHPPYPKTYEGEASPAPSNDQVVWVKKDELDRYGFQLSITPLKAYQNSIAALDKYAQSKLGKNFVDLAEDQQDTILADLEDGNASGFDEPTDKTFFKMVRDDTIEGMFCDPLYGGNRNFAGWKLVGYPGAQRAYTPSDLVSQAPPRAPQGLAELMAFHPGQPANPDVVLPVSGSRQHGGAGSSATQGRPGPGQ